LLFLTIFFLSIISVYTEVLRLRGGAFEEENLDQTILAARAKSLQEEVNSKLNKVCAFSAAAVRHLRQVLFATTDCGGLLGVDVSKDTFHTDLLYFAGGILNFNLYLLWNLGN
jgi:hypothetical protein